MLDFANIHTHTPGLPGSILSIPPSEVEALIHNNESLSPGNRQYYSIQLHPWHLSIQEITKFREVVATASSDPYFVAIGECGLDSLCEKSLELQLQAFHEALTLAHELHKPVIIHCVRLWAEMRAEVAGIFGNPAPLDPPIIIHGFRKGTVFAQQLLNAGFSLSLGLRFNPDILNTIPSNRLYHETD